MTPHTEESDEAVQTWQAEVAEAVQPHGVADASAERASYSPDERWHSSLTMTCYKPLSGYYVKAHRRWVAHAPSFSSDPAQDFFTMDVACGQCTGCRLERARQWAVRCEHEMSLYQDNCFITLTFDDEHLPDDESINVRDMQLFFKRLLKRFAPRKIRRLYCGEYGEDNLRPHYHAILFNVDFPDRKVFKRLPSGHTIDTSAILGELWPYGFSSVGTASFESAAYVASYCLKKVTGDPAADHYRRITRYGEEVQVVPEFANMSKGIGKGWYDKFERDVFPANRVVSRGNRVGMPPRYYAKKFAEKKPLVWEALQDMRLEAGEAQAWNNTPERLAVREQVLLSRLSHGKRSL